jgi:prepilin-type N-terminal cleavage/methylation domain-containing protein
MKRKGLTLIELLVVVAVLSILGVSLYTVFNSGVDAWDAAVERLEIYQNTRFVLDRMTRELSGAFVDEGAIVTLSGAVPASATAPIFWSDRNIVAGHAVQEVLLAIVTADCIYKIKYQTGWNAEEEIFVLQRYYVENPNNFGFSGISGEAWKFSGTLLVDNFYMEFYDGNTEAWRQEWLAMKCKILPQAVKIILTMQDDDGNTYPFETIVYLPNSETGG